MPKQPKIKRYLKNVDVQFISLVDAAANRREFIYKSASGGDPDFTTQFRIAKTDVEKQLVYGIVYAPDEADTHGDGMTSDEIEKAAHNFLAKARTSNVDTQHDNQPDDGLIVESYILAKDDARFPGEKEGAWGVVIKVTDPETWEAVKKGELKGISLAGKAQAEEVEDEDSLEKSLELFMSKFTTKLADIFKGSNNTETVEKDFKSRITQRELRSSVWALEEELSSIWNDEEQEDKKAAIITAVDQFKDYISKLELGGTTNTEKTEKMSTEEKEKTEKAESAKPENAEKTETTEKAGGESGDALAKTVEALAKSVEDLSAKVEEISKAAPARQTTEEGVDVEKSNEDYNPKAPFSFVPKK